MDHNGILINKLLIRDAENPWAVIAIKTEREN